MHLSYELKLKKWTLFCFLGNDNVPWCTLLQRVSVYICVHPYRVYGFLEICCSLFMLTTEYMYIP